MGRLLDNLLTTRFAMSRAFPGQVLDAIETAVRHAEAQHGGEIRFAIETALDLPVLWRRVTVRERAQDVFASLRVWDTAENSGVLIYVLLAERRIEIVADRGYAGRVDDSDWQRVCDAMRAAFTRGDFENGSAEGVRAVSSIIAEVFPRDPDDTNELIDRPALL